ncbi:chaperone protein dnaJ 11, chloroplastic [Andrographis paniculata]|uniref:chaperone protein dnaJ 11, chloroplastic n=1 Tax=Andrographis paniculata TaxID=175694 RepID=UPI0021E802CF|nr:chaperone protein dnaJ 11, chloroplastic [Andrographis paniculata]
MMQGTLTIAANPYLPLRQSQRRRLSVRAGAVLAEVDRRSLYEVLRIEKDASPGEIKTAYRTLAKLYHPDAASRFLESSSCSDGRDFIEIRNAYATLSDPDARAVYDLKLKVDSRRGWSGVGAEAIGGVGRRRSSTGRRWETDQCW